MARMISGVKVEWYDAHIDHPGQGGYGSDEQLSDLRLLDGGVRVFFCEEEGRPPATVQDHLRAVDLLRGPIAATTPMAWIWGSRKNFCVEGMEGVHDIRGVIRMIAGLQARGVRAGIPLYHPGSSLGGCSKEPDEGLTRMGRMLVSQMMRQDWVVDIAHMSHASAWETLAMVGDTSSLAYSHGGIQHADITDPALTNGNIERCLSWELAQEVIRLGGLVALSPCRPFYNSMDDFLEHLIGLAESSVGPEGDSGWGYVGIGTDYGGIFDHWRLPGCHTIGNTFAQVQAGLLRSGVHPRDIALAMGQNVKIIYSRHLHPVR